MFRIRPPFQARFIACCLAIYIAGCGAPGAPLPPTLSLPDPVENLAATRAGDAVHLTWTMPARTTDKVILSGSIPVAICRAVQTDLCVAVATLSLKPGEPASYTDLLPPNLTQGKGLLLHYEVDLRNHAGKSAGPSNPAYSVAGIAPPPLTELAGEVRSTGVVLAWHPIPDPERPMLFRIERTQLNVITTDQHGRSPLAPQATPVTQVLLVHVPAGSDPGHAVDTSVVFNQQYRYTVERVATAGFSDHDLQVEGPSSQAIVVSTVDKFPPAVPQGLAAVADPVGGAIDISWIPNTESDLAGYRIYRRDLQAAKPAHPIASVAAETSFRDTGVQAGHSYAYSIAAADQNNNVSKPSLEVEETLPAP